MNTSNYIFVYGTLKRGFSNDTARYLHTSQEFVGQGFIPGKLFKVDFYPGAVYLPEAKTKVYGDLFKIGDKGDKLFSILDEYEGIAPHFPAPNEFIKQIVPVHCEGEIIPAHSYLYNLDYQQYPLVSSGNFKAG